VLSTKSVLNRNKLVSPEPWRVVAGVDLVNRATPIPRLVLEQATVTQRAGDPRKGERAGVRFPFGSNYSSIIACSAATQSQAAFQRTS
jgi:hypothetical protein